MHATPESFGLNQSPLAAVLACARLPYTSALLDSEELRGCKHLPSKLGAFAARVRSTFLRLSTSWSDQFQPRGSRALTWASLSTSRKLSSADCWVSNLPLIVGADQSPPGQGPGSQWSGAGPFHPKNPGRLTFFSRILTGEKYAAHTRGSQRRGRTRYAGDPCTCGRAEPPNLLLQFVGIPEVYAQQVYIEDIQIGVAVLAL